MSERVKVTSKTPESKRDNSVSQKQGTNFSHPLRPPVNHIIFLQRTIGNQAVQRLFKSGVIQAKLKIGQPGDKYEQEADLVAEQVIANRTASLPVSSIAFGRLQREDAPKEKTNEEKYKEGLEKLGEAFLKTPQGKELLEKIKQDALVKGATELGKDFISTLPGKIVTGAVATGAVAALAATHKELPAQIPEIPLDVLTSGLSVQLTYKGPVDKPTEAMIMFRFTEQVSKVRTDKKPMSETDKFRAETARIAAEDAKFRAGMIYEPGSPEDLQQKAEQEAIRRAVLKYSGGPDLDAMLKQYPWLATQQPKTGLQLTTPKPSFGYRSPPLLANEFKFKLPGEQKKKEDEPKLQRKADNNATTDVAVPVVHYVLSSAGQPLDRSTRSFMESRFGHDFSRVRIHTDAHAAASARAVDATAYTVGNDIVFGHGRFAPGTQEGKRLIAHELTHVVQQSGADGIRVGQSNENRGLSPDDYRTLMAHELTHVVQQRLRPDLASTVQRNDDPRSDTSAGAGERTWLEILPRRNIKGYDLNAPWKGRKESVIYHNDPGKAPSLSYNDAKADTQPSGATEEEIDAAVTQIIAARNRIPDRGIHRDSAAGNKGNVYYLEGQYGKIPGTNQYGIVHADTSAEAERYKAWAAKNGLPSDKANFDPARDMDKWGLFQAMAKLEGRATTVTAGAVDKTVTIGAGISSAGGGAQRVLDKVFQLSPETQASALAVGLQIGGSGAAKRFVVADTEKKCILDGPDAENYVAASPALLSLIANVTLGAQGSLAQNPDGGAALAVQTDEEKSAAQRQAMVDAQWVEVCATTFKGYDNSAVSRWKNMPSKVLAVHAHHAWAPYSLNWDWAASENTEGLVRIIYRLGPKNAHLICNGEPYSSILAKVKAEERAAKRAATRPKEMSEIEMGYVKIGNTFISYKIDYPTGRMVGVMVDGTKVFVDASPAAGP